jgi:hypothetical protein
MALNVLMPFSYLGFSGLSGVGDWASFIDGLRPAFLYRALLLVVGAYLYIDVAGRILMPGLNAYLGKDPVERAARAKSVALVPYLAGGTLFVAAGLLNPLGFVLLLMSAVAASFGGTSWLAWYPGGRRDVTVDTAPPHAAPIGRSVPWLIAAAVTIFVFIGILGRGVRFD